MMYLFREVEDAAARRKRTIWEILRKESPGTLIGEVGLFFITYGSLGAFGLWAIGQFFSTDNWLARTLPLGSWIIVLGALLYQSIIEVPAVHYGNCHAFGKRIGIWFEEGLHWRSWWWEVKLFPATKLTKKISESFTTKDRVEVTISGVIQYYPDIDLLSSLFETLSESAIDEGLESLIKQKLGELVSQYNYGDLIERRTQISELINCALRLRREPQFDLREFATKLLEHILSGRAEEVKNVLFEQADQDLIKTIKDRGSPPSEKEIADFIETLKKKFEGKWLTSDQNGIKPEYWLEFLELFQRTIRMLLREESDPSQKEERSRTERDYAINIERFNLSDIAWTEKFRDAIERVKQAEAEAQAAAAKGRSVLEIVKSIREGDPNKGILALDEVNQSTALHAAMAIQGLSGHQTFATEGGGQGTTIIPVINAPSQPKGGS